MAFHLNKHKSPSSQDALSCFVEIGPVVLEKKILKCFHYNFYNFRYYLPLERGVALYFNKLDTPPPKNALCQVWFKLAKRFWRRRFFLNILNRNLLFHYYLPSKKDVALHLNKLESPSPKDALCQVWYKLIGPVVLEKKILKYFQYNITF